MAEENDLNGIDNKATWTMYLVSISYPFTLPDCILILLDDLPELRHHPGKGSRPFQLAYR